METKLATITLPYNKICRCFVSQQDAIAYMTKFCPNIANPQVVRVVKPGFGSAYSITMEDTLSGERLLFGLADESKSNTETKLQETESPVVVNLSPKEAEILACALDLVRANIETLMNAMSENIAPEELVKLRKKLQ